MKSRVLVTLHWVPSLLGELTRSSKYSHAFGKELIQVL